MACRRPTTKKREDSIMYNKGPKTFQLGTGGGVLSRLVKLAAGLAVLNTAAASDEPIGAIVGMDGTGEEGDYAAIQFLKDEGTLELEAAAAVGLNADVFAADEGKIQPLPADPADVGAWQSETAYSLGDIAVPTSDNGHYYKCTVAGTTAASEPTWPEDGSTVSDGTAEWTDMGSNVFHKIGKSLQAASAAGSIIEVLPYDFHKQVTLE
jgi:hypothetical protein